MMKRLVQGGAACIVLALTTPAAAQETTQTAQPTWSTPSASSSPPASPPRTQTIIVRDAEGRPVDAKLSVVDANGDRILLVTTPAPPAAPPTPPPPTSVERQESGSPWPYVILGGGAALAMTSAIFQLVAINEDSDARHYYWTSTRSDLSTDTRGLLREASDSHFDAAKTDQAIAITCGILAVTAVTVAVTWLVAGRR